MTLWPILAFIRPRLIPDFRSLKRLLFARFRGNCVVVPNLSEPFVPCCNPMSPFLRNEDGADDVKRFAVFFTLAMIPDSALPTLRATCRTLQVIVLALATGVCIFAVIAVVQTKGQLTWEFPPGQMLDSIFLLMGMMALVGSFIVPALVTAPGVAKSKLPSADDHGTQAALQAAATIQTRTIIACALVEGGAFANLVAVSHGYGPPLVLAALLMSMIVLQFPTWSRYLQRIEAAVRRAEERA